VFFGVRGATALDITVYGPNRGLHSGHYGNWAPNPIVHAHASARQHARHAGAHSDSWLLRRRARANASGAARPRAQMPDYDAQIKRDLGLARTEARPHRCKRSCCCRR
jgi:hypothetical protein